MRYIIRCYRTDLEDGELSRLPSLDRNYVDMAKAVDYMAEACDNGCLVELEVRDRTGSARCRSPPSRSGWAPWLWL